MFSFTALCTYSSKHSIPGVICHRQAVRPSVHLSVTLIDSVTCKVITPGISLESFARPSCTETAPNFRRNTSRPAA